MAVTEGKFSARVAYINAAGVPARLYELDSPEFDSMDGAIEAGLDSVNGHDFANRIHIMHGVRDKYDGTVYADCVEEHDICRG
jgi:hypothetical protein